MISGRSPPPRSNSRTPRAPSNSRVPDAAEVAKSSGGGRPPQVRRPPPKAVVFRIKGATTVFFLRVLQRIRTKISTEIAALNHRHKSSSPPPKLRRSARPSCQNAHLVTQEDEAPPFDYECAHWRGGRAESGARRGRRSRASCKRPFARSVLRGREGMGRRLQPPGPRLFRHELRVHCVPWRGGSVCRFSPVRT